jgi:hypothetical protein
MQISLLRHGWVIKDCAITAMLWTAGGDLFGRHIFVILFYSCFTIHYEYISIKNMRREGLILNLTRLVNDNLTHVVENGV